MTLFSKKTEDKIKKVLEILSNGKLQSFTQLKEASGLSPPTITKYLKKLQIEKLISNDIETRKYKIEKKGLDWLSKSNAANTTIKDGAIIEKTATSVPVNSIVAIDIQNISEAQQRVFMDGTPIAAAACFNQFYLDRQKMGGKLPANGRIVYTTVINLNEVNDWFDSKQGKDYIKKNQK
jgi:DNA-binding Lrp family transcriptional regulator